MQKNFFIVLDGLDGSGKGEMLTKLQTYLQEKGYNVFVTQEPSESVYGKQIRKQLQEDTDPEKDAEKLLNLYIKDREEHLKKEIIPFLQNHQKAIVLCDRYYYATIAYQSIQGIPVEEIIQKNQHFKQPDLALILNVNPDVALERINKARNQTEKFEQLEFMQKLQKRFLELKELLQDNIIIIDANKQIDEVFTQLTEEVNKLIN